MKILFLSRWFPYPIDNGSKIRIYNLLKGLSRHHQVTLLAHADSVNEQGLSHLRSFCAKVETVPWKEFNPTRARAILGFASLKPRSLVDTFSPRMHELIQKELAGSPKYDFVVASELSMAAYIQDFGGIPALFEDAELSAYYERYARARTGLSKLLGGLSWLKLKWYLSHLLSGYQAVTVVSEKDRALISTIAPSSTTIHIIPNCLDISSYMDHTATPEPKTLLFSGSFAYSANFNAVTYFLREIFPLICQRIPDVRFRISGRSDGKVLDASLLNDRVEIIGYVEDIKSVIAGSWVSVVPLLEGGGTRLKILEAFALGTPVVSTSKGAEGLDACPGEHLLIGDTPQDFAESTIQLMSDPNLRNRLIENGRRLVQEHYNWDSVMPEFLDIIVKITKRKNSA